MKLLGNPWIVGGLCVVAAGVVGYQVLMPRNRAGVSPVLAPHSVLPVPPGPAASATSDQSTAPTTLIDRDYVQSRFAQWLQAPRRDPFLWSQAGRPGSAAAALVNHWRLRAIWRQTGSRLAVINNRIYAEGELIEGHRVDAIESDRVWLEGPAGRVSLSFTNPPSTNAAPPGTNAPGHQMR